MAGAQLGGEGVQRLLGAGDKHHFAALAVSRDLQDRTGVTIKKLVQTLRTARSATIEINGRRMTLDPEPTAPVRAILDRLQGGR